MHHEKERKRQKISINDHPDILIEILTRLDGPSLATASSVCRLWRTLLTDDLLWETICFRHTYPLVRPVVTALGGYQRLYTHCVRPLLVQLGRSRLGHPNLGSERWTKHEVELSMSLFCVEYYERMSGDGVVAPPSSSLMFLCEPVNV